MYSAALGSRGALIPRMNAKPARLMQTEPIGDGPPSPIASDSGAGDGLNFYAYVGNDPINFVDPLGLAGEDPCGSDPNCTDGGEITVTGRRYSYAICGGGTGVDCRQMVMDIRLSALIACDNGLRAANQDRGAVARANAAMDTLRDAAGASGIDPRLLAAIGVRESGFRNVNERDGAGVGVGVFQLTVRSGGPYTAADASRLDSAAYLAAAHLRNDMNQLYSNHPSLAVQNMLTKATAAAYNIGPGNISGNPSSIDTGTAGNNYGQSILDLTHCF